MIYLRRGEEWASIQPCAEGDPDYVLWLYGQGKVGNSSSVCPRAVMSSQIAAHMSKGWEIVFSHLERKLNDHN